jgi:hypothetical protein
MALWSSGVTWSSNILWRPFGSEVAAYSFIPWSNILAHLTFALLVDDQETASVCRPWTEHPNTLFSFPLSARRAFVMAAKGQRGATPSSLVSHGGPVPPRPVGGS